jgi:hypothetical protein
VVQMEAEHGWVSGVGGGIRMRHPILPGGRSLVVLGLPTPPPSPPVRELD